MTFIHDRKTEGVVDPVHGVSLHLAHRWEEPVGRFPNFEYICCYEGPIASFKFRLIVHQEQRRYVAKGAHVDENLDVEAQLIEPSIQQGLAEAGTRSLSSAEYEKIKHEISIGVTSWWTPRYLDGTPIIPDFKVQFLTKSPMA